MMNFTRRRHCVKCGAQTKADRAIQRDKVYCMDCRYPNRKTDVQASEPAGESK